MSGPRPRGVALPAQPDTLGALEAMRAIILSECLVGGVTPFAALSAADAARYGVSYAAFIGRPKDVNDAYLPQLNLWIPAEPDSAAQSPGNEVALVGVVGRANATFEAIVHVMVDMRADWYASERQALAIRDALWSALLRHERLAGLAPTVTASEARPGRGLTYEQIAGVEYRVIEARWWARQEWLIAGGLVV
ncbi:MAG TPA: hypothetical protein VE338_01100 [Ktedonobacterales bacterium]|jgi:hypothetical protein|nr:hypothetical protein [Ktedonobacterales bacterium]